MKLILAIFAITQIATAKYCESWWIAFSPSLFLLLCAFGSLTGAWIGNKFRRKQVENIDDENSYV